MTEITTKLLNRLDEIGRSLADTPQALALIGLGSVGLELERLDAYSDLDFFVIVENGSQVRFLTDLSWLSDIEPISFQFLNSADGYKLMFLDGIFCEFAVFEIDRLAALPFSPGRIVWKAAGISDQIGSPQPLAPRPKPSLEWLLGEAITNLYVGLGRDRRGEKLSAMQFIQGYAVDRLADLSVYLDTAVTTVPGAAADTFDSRRRYETRHHTLARHLPQFLQGYERNRESARAILHFLDHHFEVNQPMKEAIITLCDLQ